MFPRDMVCLRNISVDTLHKRDTDDDDMIMMMMHGTYTTLTRGQIIRKCVRSHDLHLCIIHHKKDIITQE
jgi:hypothetical protein